MKAFSIPKLELYTALLAVRFNVDICIALTIPIMDAFMWTDSAIVLLLLN